MVPNTAQLQEKSDLKTAQNLLSKAKTRCLEEEFDEAIELSQKAMKIFEAHEEWEGFMEAAYELAGAYKKNHSFSKTIQLVDDTLNIHQEKCPHLSIWKAHLLHEKASAFHYDNKINEAIRYYTEVCQFMQKEEKEHELLIYTLVNLLPCYAVFDQQTEGQRVLDTASELLNKGKQYDNALIGEYYLYKGEWEFYLSKYELAKQSFKKAHEVLPPRMHHKKSQAYRRMGTMHGLLGNSEKELEHYHKVASQYSSPKNKEDKLMLLRVYQSIGQCLSKLGDSKQALYYFENALRILEDSLRKGSLTAFTLLVNIASSHKKEGNYSKAIEYLERALEIGERTFGAKNARMGMVYRELADVYRYLGNMDTALIYIKKALVLLEETLGEKHIYTLQTYRDMGILWMSKKNYSEGLRYFYKALNGFRNECGDLYTEIPFIYKEIGKNLYLQGKLLPALKHFQLALTTSIFNHQETDFYELPDVKQCSFIDSNLFFRILEGKAKALFDYFHVLEQNQSPEAIKALQASLATCQLAADYLKELQKTLKAEDSKLIYAERMSPIYQLAIKIISVLSNRLGVDSILEKAFDFHELAKGLVLRVSMQENEAKLQVAIDPELLKQEKDFKNQIETYLKRIQKEEAKGAKRGEKALKEWKQKHFDALQSHQTLIERFEKEYPDYYQLKYNFQTVSVSDLQADLADNTVVVSYFIGPELGYIFVVTPYDYEVVSFDVPKDFDQRIESYLASIHAQNFKEFSRQSYALYCLLIQPIEDLIFDPFGSELQQLVILPSGALHYLPFETLIRAAPKPHSSAFHQLEYLLKKYNIQYHYSATLYHQYLQKGKKKNDLTPPTSNVGTPDFIGFAPIYTSDKAATQEALRELAADYSRWATRSDALEDDTLAPLPFSEKEVQNIEALFTQKGLKGQSFLYDSATKHHFKTLAADAKYLHIAAHGLTNDEFPKLSGIVFHPTEEATEIQDSVLSMGEMYQLQLQADLVVLSSCESGIGRLEKGEGMMAMNRGFLHAGAKNVIYTLFKVLDKPSSELCEALFEGILEGKSYSEALRLAKLRLIEREDVDPKSWSGFVLLGAS